MRSLLVPAILGLILLAIGLVVRSGWLARENPGRPINAAMRESMEKTAYDWPPGDRALITKRFPQTADKPEGRDPSVFETPSGMLYILRTAGTGDDKPQRGQTATVNYVATFLDGANFDSSAAHGGPFNFIVGQGRVIAAWDEAILSMKKGEKRTLIVPFWLGYGERGISRKIPAKATLVFDVELVDFR